MVLRVQRVLTRVDTREGFERRVCEELVDTDGSPFVWIGAIGDDPERLESLGQAGRDRGYLDAIDSTPIDSDEPTARTAE